RPAPAPPAAPEPPAPEAAEPAAPEAAQPTTPQAPHPAAPEAPQAAAPAQPSPPATPAQHEPAPSATPAATAEVPDLERLAGLWTAVLDQVREQGSELLSHALSVARPTGVDQEGSTVEIGFPPGASFNKRKAETVESRERIAEALSAVTGARLRP